MNGVVLYRFFLFDGVCSNSRHPGHRRVWRGGSEQHLMTPLPLAAAAMADEFRDPPEPMIPFGAVLKNSPYFDGHTPPIQILCFLTHMRDLAALLPGNCSQFRCGSFLFQKNRDFSKTSRNTLQKISANSENMFCLIANIEANRK